MGIVNSIGTQPGSPKQSALFSVAGMSCSGCARKVTQSLENLDRVIEASVDLDRGLASVTWSEEPGKEHRQQVLDAILQAGFKAEPLKGAGTTPGTGFRGLMEKALSGWQINLWLAGPVFVLMAVTEWFLPFAHHPSWKWIAFGLATPVQIICGSKFYLGAWRQGRTGQFNMDTLVSIGSTAAYGYSVWLLFSGTQGHAYFMDSAGILFLISLGHWLESRMNQKASRSLNELMRLTPEQARLISDNGMHKEVPVSSVTTGDVIMVLPGEKIPLDGQIIEGITTIDSSIVTGESLPVEASPGSKVIGGTINLNKSVKVKVTAVGQDTVVARILAMVKKAQANKAAIQRLGDRVSNVFVPCVIGLALLTLTVWGLAPEWMGGISRTLFPFIPSDAPHAMGTWAKAIMNATAVLIIACPCAMGLATPVALMAGTSLAARRGILIRDAAAIEKSGVIDCLVFDKTGTLTTHELSIDETVLNPDKDTDMNRFRSWVGSLASHSNHPISRALSDGYQDDGHFVDVEEHPGKGISARNRHGQGRFLLGSKSFLESHNVELPDEITQFHVRHSAKGASTIILAEDQRACGAVALSGQLKPGIAAVIRKMRDLHLKVYLLTGDQKEAAMKTAADAGIDPENVMANVQPDEKATVIERLQKEGYKVGFVGDGINDAPALRQANLGIAVTRANDIAKEAADIILLQSDIDAVPTALDLSRRTLRTIKQNLFWAFFYNAMGIPIAMLGLINPLICAAAMGMSDLIVIGNALRLRNTK